MKTGMIGIVMISVIAETGSAKNVTMTSSGIAIAVSRSCGRYLPK